MTFHSANSDTPYGVKTPYTLNMFVTMRMSKPLADATDFIGNRLSTIDGVEEVEVTTDPVKSCDLVESFDDLIERFNKMYNLPCPDVPGLQFAYKNRKDLIARIDKFVEILREELEESEEIINAIMRLEDEHVLMTMLADWFGDIQVYCASELRKIGIRNEDILRIIMASNFSKLDLDGKPIYDERGKVLKGPNYWKPEPMIQRYISATIRQGGYRG